LLRTHYVCGPNEFCRPAELCASSGSGHHSPSLLPTDERSGIRVCVRTGFYGQGLARKHRLVELDRSSNQMHIGSNHAASDNLIRSPQTSSAAEQSSMCRPVDRRVECQTGSESGEGCLARLSWKYARAALKRSSAAMTQLRNTYAGRSQARWTLQAAMHRRQNFANALRSG